jgi:hypothetical protein
MVLALVATLVVAGPGMVLAGGNGPNYTKPTIAVLVGPGSVKTNGLATYSLKVTFSDGSSTTYTGAPATFDAVKGSFSGNTYTAPSGPGKDGVEGTLSQNGAFATGHKIITITP